LADDFAEFQKPPINELVLGAQFQTTPGYNQLIAAEIWSGLRDRYPKILVQPAIPPRFETFGGHTGETIQFGFGPPVSDPRFWWLDNSEHNLVQFQSDKLFVNWRQLDHDLVPYPRFEYLYAEFERVAGLVNGTLNTLLGAPPAFNQAEVSYYNRIYGSDPRQLPKPDDWLRFLDFGARTAEQFNGMYQEVIEREGKPAGRLYVAVNSGIDSLGRFMIVLELTFRGKPVNDGAPAVLELFKFGREVIAKAFRDMTTESAQRLWQAGD
jgi:uncharacterized protein (TIGR04255 family)